MPITINDCRNCNKPPMILKVEEHLNEEFELACGGCGQETETFDEEAIEEWNTANPGRTMPITIEEVDRRARRQAWIIFGSALAGWLVYHLLEKLFLADVVEGICR